MEEVVGSIPTRSTKSLNNLNDLGSHRNVICAMVCVITRFFGAHGEGFHGIAFRFHPHVTVTLQHATTNVSGDCHDCGIGRAVLRKLSDCTMPKIVKPEARFLGERSPCGSPAVEVSR